MPTDKWRTALGVSRGGREGREGGRESEGQRRG